MLYREIMTVCSEIHTKHINTQCGQNVEMLNVKLAVNIVTTGMKVVEISDQAPEALMSVLALSCTVHKVTPASHTNCILDVINKTGSTPDDKKRKYLALTSDRTAAAVHLVLCQCLTDWLTDWLTDCTYGWLAVCLSVCLSAAALRSSLSTETTGFS